MLAVGDDARKGGKGKLAVRHVIKSEHARTLGGFLLVGCRILFVASQMPCKFKTGIRHNIFFCLKRDQANDVIGKIRILHFEAALLFGETGKYWMAPHRMDRLFYHCEQETPQHGPFSSPSM